MDKILIEKDGIYYIGKKELDNVDPSLSLRNPKSYSLYMSNELGRPRSYELNQDIPDNFKEVSIFFSGEDDGVFDDNDKIIFYGRGPSGFGLENNELIWEQNIYFNYSNCWLFIPDDENYKGKRIQDANQPQNGTIVDYGINYVHIEADILNLETSGTEWLSNSIDGGSSQTVVTNLPSPKIGGNLDFESRLRGASASTGSASHSISLHLKMRIDYIIGNSLNWTGNSARILSASSNDLNLTNGINFFYLKNSSYDINSTPYLDYIEVQYDRNLNMNESFAFISPVENQNTRFSFSKLLTQIFYYGIYQTREILKT